MTATYIGPKKSYQLTDDDMLWAARMIVGEGGENCSRTKAAAYLWAMINRFMFYGKWKRYHELLRKFSQPINPIWLRTGSKCKPGGPYHGRDECSEARLARRERTTNMAWENIPVTIRYFVREFAGGILPPPSSWGRRRVSNWAVSTIKNKVDGKWLPLPQAYPQGLAMGDEWFFEDPGLPPGNISIEGATGPLPIGPRPIGFLGALFTVSLAAAVSFGAWLAYRTFYKK